MPLFQKAIFHTTVAHLRDLPTDACCEVAFAGRSNAGKSSAINTLANHTRLAYVSKTPGRTQHLNYFLLEEGKYLVDLPGYGFAKAPEEIRSQWEGLLAPYLRYREALAGLVLIMDSRHPLTELDLQMLEWFSQTGKPIHVLLSKADKLTRQEQANALCGVRIALDKLVAEKGCGNQGEKSEPESGCYTLQLFSSLKKTGVAEAERILGAWLGMAPIDERLPPPAPRTEKAARPKNRAAIGWSARSAKAQGSKKPPAKGEPGAKEP